MSKKRIELCIECDQPTGRAGRLDDSLYRDGKGPYCEECVPCEYCGAARMDGCDCHEGIVGFPENCSKD